MVKNGKSVVVGRKKNSISSVLQAKIEERSRKVLGAWQTFHSPSREKQKIGGGGGGVGRSRLTLNISTTNE